jgi:hypothetical protein
MRSKRALASIGACISLFIAPFHGTAAAQDSEAPAAVQTPEQALRADAAFYSREQGVAIEEAMKRLQAMDAAGELVSNLRESHAGRLAGIYYEHKPELRLVVRLTGTAPVASTQTALAAGGSIRTDFVVGAPATQSDLFALVDANLGRIQALLPTLQGVSVSDRTGEIVLDVFATGVAATSALAQDSTLETLLKNPVKINVIGAPLKRQAVRGGSHLSVGCTTGFVAKNGTQSGVLSAAHCGAGSVTYTDAVDGTSYTLTPTLSRNDASHDVHFMPSSATLPQFYADTNVPRVLTGRRLQSSTATGNQVCHRGIGSTSRYSCGWVENTAYKPVWDCGPAGTPITCAYTWVQVGGSTLACYGGDSGGPWFIGQTAVGIHNGGSSYGPATGQCIYGVYMSTDRITGLGSGVALTYGP